MLVLPWYYTQFANKLCVVATGQKKKFVLQSEKFAALACIGALPHNKVMVHELLCCGVKLSENN